MFTNRTDKTRTCLQCSAPFTQQAVNQTYCFDCSAWRQRANNYPEIWTLVKEGRMEEAKSLMAAKKTRRSSHHAADVPLRRETGLNGLVEALQGIPAPLRQVGEVCRDMREEATRVNTTYGHPATVATVTCECGRKLHSGQTACKCGRR